MIQIKILSYKSPQRYAVRRTLTAAQNELQKTCPAMAVEVSEVKQLSEMLTYTPVVILPSLVINEKLVCIGRFPRKDEVITWLQEAMTRQD
ncbi:MAG: hypothetical protein EHM41_19855 [Chloroflexi bacterium]|nr:MAG: hypothetical protein EHM41_19855 [Chloroflexota bacterium]